MKKLLGFTSQMDNSTLELQKLQLADILQMCTELERGNFQVDTPDSIRNTEYGAALMKLAQQLLSMSRKEAQQEWESNGLHDFFTLFKNPEGNDIETLMNQVLIKLARYVNAQQGALYFIAKDNHQKEQLRCVAGYACETPVAEMDPIAVGEGLVGQCAYTREGVLLKTLPENFFPLSSGLGRVQAKAVMIYPLIANQQIIGVLELSFLSAPEKRIQTFIEKIIEHLAIALKSEKDHVLTSNLLADSQQLTEEMRAQEEELRQNLEELQTTQEEMYQKSQEISRRAAESDSILRGINATMATIEFTPDGIILNANENFLQATGYTLEQVQGRHHKMFVPNEILLSDAYQHFWKDLSEGKSISGTFKRKNKNGKVLWLNAIYNPIIDAAGNVLRIVKFATDITATQELIAENKGVMDGINATMATVEFEPDGTILTANQNFLDTMDCNLELIQGQHHSIFMPSESIDNEYKEFWQKLASGKPISGIFRRMTQRGEEVWLNAIYNPITNSEGKVIKVMKLACQISTQDQLARVSALAK